MNYAKTDINKLSSRPRGFTLLETMVAVSLLAVAIVAPMSLTAQSLASAYYARDQITAFYLAQEGLEVVRNIRDNNILQNSQSTSGTVNLLNGIPITTPFTVDATVAYTAINPPPTCSGTCAPLKTDGVLYNYTASIPTQFTRTLTACYVHAPPPIDTGGCNSTFSDEIKITVTVTWKTGNIQQRTVSVSENLYRWVADGSASG